VDINEVKVEVPLLVSTPLLTSTSNVVSVTKVNTRQNLNEEILLEGTSSQVSDIIESQEVVLRMSERQKRPAISNDHVIYLQESDFDIGIKKDPVSFLQAVESNESEKWINVMKEKGIDYKETFSPVSKNESLRIILAL